MLQGFNGQKSFNKKKTKRKGKTKPTKREHVYLCIYIYINTHSNTHTHPTLTTCVSCVSTMIAIDLWLVHIGFVPKNLYGNLRGFNVNLQHFLVPKWCVYARTLEGVEVVRFQLLLRLPAFYFRRGSESQIQSYKFNITWPCMRKVLGKWAIVSSQKHSRTSNCIYVIKLSPKRDQ